MPARLFSVLLLVVFSCGPAEKKWDEAAVFEIEKKYERGPLTLLLKIDKKEITIADRITFVLDATIGKEYHIQFPEFGENLEQFSIVDFRNPAPKLVDDLHIRKTVTYELEPFLSGEYTIPAMTVKFWTDEEDPDDPHILQTEAETITVTSILTEEGKLEVKDVTGPVSPPPPDLGWLFTLIGGIILGGAGIAGGLVWFFHSRKADNPIITIPAHEAAFRELKSLVAMGLVEKGAYREFYFRISNILRHYLENRFHLHAPEQTTEEFLHDIKQRELLSAEQKKRLSAFLTHCDLVKFATHLPTNEEVQSTFDCCKDFITTTRDDNARIEERTSTVKTADTNAETKAPPHSGGTIGEMSDDAVADTSDGKAVDTSKHTTIDSSRHTMERKEGK